MTDKARITIAALLTVLFLLAISAAGTSLQGGRSVVPAASPVQTAAYPAAHSPHIEIAENND